MYPYPMVLVGSHSHKFGLGEVDRLEVFRLRHIFIFRVDVHYMETRLVLVHGVQDYLKHNP